MRGTRRLVATPRVLVLLVAIVHFAYSQNASSQQLFEENLDEVCSYGGENIIDDIYTFASSREAWEIIRSITDLVGLKPNFDVRAANVPNAAAVIYGTQRLILYSQNFIRTILDQTQTDWAGKSILAHEIGHHLQGHTLQPGGSRPVLELEADEFSGFVIRLLEGSLDEATIAMRTFASPNGSDTHPPRSARLEAIAVGWNRANEQLLRGNGETARLPRKEPTETETARLPSPAEQTPEARAPRFQTVREIEDYLVGKWCTLYSDKYLSFLEEFVRREGMGCIEEWKEYARLDDQFQFRNSCRPQWIVISVPPAWFNRSYTFLNRNALEWKGSDRDRDLITQYIRCQ